MPKDHLGLYDTPPDRREVRFAIAIVAALFAALLLLLPVRNIRWAEVPAFIPAVNASMFVGELIIAALLYAQASVFRSRALLVLATGYAFTAFLIVPHTLTFPGAFTPDGLLGAGINTTAWIATARRIGLPIFVTAYVLLTRGPPRTIDSGLRGSIAIALFSALALASAVTLVATLAHDILPTFFTNRTDVVVDTLVLTTLAVIGVTLVAIVLLLRKRKSVLDIWLLVAMSAWLIQSMLNLPLIGRFTLGFYALYVLMVISHLVVLIALIAESNRLYARLAVATAARNREREAQRMSMDAVAAAIAHEVGQPLAALTLSTSAGLNWLTSARPNVAKAIESLHAVGDSGRRSFDVLKSIRAMFSKEPGWATELDLNALVHETLSMMEAELAGAKVALQLSLDEGLPPVLGNRVQVQHVISNLVANAIESLSSTRGRRRRITIRTALDGCKALLEVSDNGAGIAAEDTWTVFEAFQETKAGSKGIGLALCRTIVEEHSGRIWASRGEPLGATFHVHLPISRPAAHDADLYPFHRPG